MINNFLEKSLGNSDQSVLENRLKTLIKYFQNYRRSFFLEKLAGNSDQIFLEKSSCNSDQ